MNKKKLVSDKKILLLGATVIDVIININRLPKPGEDIKGTQKGISVGGCAYNVSKILDYFQIAHDLCVPVGQGIYADIIRNELKKINRPVLIEDQSQDNGYSLSLVENDSERTFISIDGLEGKWKNHWLSPLDVSQYDFIYLNGYSFQDDETSGDVILNFLKDKRTDCHLILDPGPRLLGNRFKDKLLSMNTILELNEHEAQSLSKENNISSAVKKLHAITKNPVIVTLGSKGTLYYTAEQSEIIPAQRVNAIDTIGAGDSHTAAFIAGLAANFDLESACQLANDTAAKVVQKIGCNIV